MSNKIINIILIILVFLTIFFPLKKDTSTSFESKNVSFIPDLKYGDVLIQEVVATDNFDKFGFESANFNKVIKKGHLKVEVTGGNKLKKFNVKVDELNDNSFIYFKYKIKKGNKYSIRISNDVKEPITLITTNAVVKNANLIINSEKKDYNLFMSFTNESANYNFTWYLLIVICVFNCYNILRRN